MHEPKIGETNEKPREKILHLEIDEVPEVDEFVGRVKDLPIEEQLVEVSKFIKSNFKNAISPHTDKLPKEEREKVNRVLRQEPKTLSGALCLEYGVCVEYHVLGKAILDKLSIPCKFKKGVVAGSPGHTFLDVQVNGAWQIFDPFAEVYLSDLGRPDLKRFDPIYYKSSETKKKSG
ncbi:MAG: hypothetical protein PHC53_00870 [Patescibacteria group bacterium]|nr:hypothetical protein [Patescibacteria group bacterium]